MIARHWRGWTTLANAGAYEAHLKEKVLPGLKNNPGYLGGYVLRRDVSGEVEFVVINLFDCSILLPPSKRLLDLTTLPPISNQRRG